MSKSPWPAGAPFTGPERHREFFDLQKRPDTSRRTTVSLVVDSRDRDKGFDAQRGPFNFTVRFEPIYNVVSAEIKLMTCPKPAGESYAVLDIPQFSTTMNSSDMTAHQKFAAVFFEPSADKPIKADMITNPQVQFETPVKLDRLDVCVRTWGGAVMQTNTSDTNVCMVLLLTCAGADTMFGV